MLYAYFGGLGADKHTTFELLLEQESSRYTVTAMATTLESAVERLERPARWRLRLPAIGSTKRLYQGARLRHGIRALLEAASAANAGRHGQRYCYVLLSVPQQPGALAALIPSVRRADNSLPFHPQLWQYGRPLDTLPIPLHSQATMGEIDPDADDLAVPARIRPKRL